MRNCLIVSFLLWFIFKQSSSNTEDYYENLIRDEISKAKQYKFNVDNREYFEGAKSKFSRNFGQYDFVVIGAGSAGSVIANRLSEIKKWKILLLEAGDDEDNFTDIPSMAFWAATSNRSWGYYSTPQTTCCQGMVDNRCHFSRGKLIGGSSAVNCMMYVRGNPNDFNRWESMGNPGWAYKDVLPYFKKSEDAEIGDLGYHSFGGLLHVSNLRPSEHPINKVFSEAMANLGQNQTGDYNGRIQLGYGNLETTIKNGRRASTGRAFIDPIRRRPNLKVTTNALVTKILIDPRKKKAYGVEFIKKGSIYKVTISKEVILSAGAINSPQILMLSGVGPKEELQKLGIQVLQDLPVGKHLQDHPLLGIFLIRTSLMETKRSLRYQVENYLNGGGSLSISGNAKQTAFINVNTPDDSNRPDIQFALSITNENPDIPVFSPAIFNYDTELSRLLQTTNTLSDFNMFVMLLHSKSLGEVTLKSNRPIDFPNIDLNYFSDKDNYDLETMYKAVQFLRKLIRTPPFSDVNAQLLIPVNISFCGSHDPDSREYWYCYLRHAVSTTFHSIGTTRMGNDIGNSVVNPKLQVHGIDNLRVADAGVMPEITSGNTNAPTIMIGEKAADLIKETHHEFKFNYSDNVHIY